MAARRRHRQQQLASAPVLRWDSVVAPSSGSDQLPDGTPIWVLRVRNAGGDATDARVVLFTAERVVRSETGESGRIERGEGWDLALDLPATHPVSPFRGYALVQGADKRWYGATVDGRSASFRTRPDELGVLRTLGLKIPHSAAEQADLTRSERAQAEIIASDATA